MMYIFIEGEELATINVNVPIEFDCEKYRVQSPKEDAIELFTKLEFSSFIKRLELTGETTKEKKEKVKKEKAPKQPKEKKEGESFWKKLTSIMFEEEEELDSAFIDDEELLSGLLSEEVFELSLPEDSETDELSPLISLISIFCELLSEELCPKTTSFSIISGSSDLVQPETENIIDITSKKQINFFIFPLLFK